MRPAKKGMAGRKERGLSFDCKQSWVGFFCFQDGEAVPVVYGCSKRPRQKEPGPRFSSDWRPT